MPISYEELKQSTNYAYLSNSCSKLSAELSDNISDLKSKLNIQIEKINIAKQKLSAGENDYTGVLNEKHVNFTERPLGKISDTTEEMEYMLKRLETQKLQCDELSIQYKAKSEELFRQYQEKKQEAE